MVWVVVVSKKPVKLDLLSEKSASNGVGIDRSLALRTVTAMPNPDKFVSKLNKSGCRSSLPLHTSRLPPHVNSLSQHRPIRQIFILP